MKRKRASREGAQGAWGVKEKARTSTGATGEPPGAARSPSRGLVVGQWGEQPVKNGAGGEGPGTKRKPMASNGLWTAGTRSETLFDPVFTCASGPGIARNSAIRSNRTTARSRNTTRYTPPNPSTCRSPPILPQLPLAPADLGSRKFFDAGCVQERTFSRFSLDSTRTNILTN